MRTPYRFINRKGKNCIQVSFAHIPGRWFSTGAKDMAGAVRFAEAKMREVTQSKGSITLGQFAEGFFGPDDPHGYRHRNERRNTFFGDTFYKQHAGRLANYILPAHGAYLLSSINDVMIEDFILDLKSKRTGRILSEDSRNKVLACYRIILQEAVREGWIDRNPAKEVKEIPTTFRKRDAFTAEELMLMFPQDDDRLLSIWGSLKWAVYFLIERDTGWRPCEVAALERANYFPEVMGVYSTKSVDYVTHGIKDSIKTTRKGQPFKAGFLSHQTDRLLRQLMAVTEGRFLFPVPSGYIYPELANKHLRLACAVCGVERRSRTQYCIRHSFNTNMIGRIPDGARLLLMAHTKDRPEYNNLGPEETLRRLLQMPGVEEAVR